METMRVVLRRTQYLADRTLGYLSVWKGPIRVFQCACLELPWKDNKARVSCIPAGVYPLVLEYSPAFKAKLYELYEVPGRSEVKLHAANYPSQLLGCIAPALGHRDINGDGVPDGVSSKVALSRFHTAMEGVLKTTIEVVGDGRDTV